VKRSRFLRFDERPVLTGQERAADRIDASGAPAALMTSDLPSASSWNTVGAVSTQSPLPMHLTLLMVIESLAIGTSAHGTLMLAE